MGPKIDSAIQFVKAAKKQVLITDVEVLREALEGKDGTVIVP
jgi:carbamate kinase